MIENKDNEAKQLKALDRKSHLCDVCGIQFFGGGKAKYCSNACKQKSKYQRTKEGTKPRHGRIRKIRMNDDDTLLVLELNNMICRLMAARNKGTQKEIDYLIIDEFADKLDLFSELLFNIEKDMFNR
ncbi:MAG: hypothetical protein M1300_04500 [Epsilonproteobacteria bacterium]|nr:hypothetical protein [Campylobacterota bacterium]